MARILAVLSLLVVCRCAADEPKDEPPAELKKDAERLSESIKSYGKYVRSRTKKSPKSPIPPLYLWLAKKGDIGYPTGQNSDEEHNLYRVLQVVGPRDMIIETRDGDSVLTEAREHLWLKRVSVWVSNHPTDGLTDNSFVHLSQVFEVIGTRQYQTITGSNTILEIRPFSIQDGQTLKKLLASDKKK